MDVRDDVATFYGEEIERTEDLEFGACCVDDYDAELTAKLTDEVLEKRYGCGSPIPSVLEGRTVLDLGCGAGADCYIASQLVGPAGRVIGVDASEDQLEVARRNVEPHMERFGYDESNVEFHRGAIEEVPLEDESVDIVISNCVINLSADKRAVYDEIHRVLKPGGEFYVSDVVADRRVPEHLREDRQLWSECLSGALYVADLGGVERRAGFRDTRIVRSELTGDVLEGVRFLSQVRRGFKLELDSGAEDYGQVAVYRGTIDRSPTAYRLDRERLFPAGEALRVCRNTARMLAESRLAPHFDVSEPLRHLGAFDRGAGESDALEVDDLEPVVASDEDEGSQADSTCCG